MSTTQTHIPLQGLVAILRGIRPEECIATTQAPNSPGLAESLAVLGKTVSLRRLAAQLGSL